MRMSVGFMCRDLRPDPGDVAEAGDSQHSRSPPPQGERFLSFSVPRGGPRFKVCECFSFAAREEGPADLPTGMAFAVLPLRCFVTTGEAPLGTGRRRLN